ncbi:CopG family transcriptional regulator [Ruania zhangjianzhongii]|uniref:CopG family transcriptional regulator n=1 Tax=Ruania zhangjianzhongii TaxID=2603206 RepID=UPI0011CC17A5|nr:CopG family transcriptional regulator [Ruania zhangjianzhongii]
MAMTLRLTPEQDEALATLAAAHRMSKHEAAVRAIEDAAARSVHRDRVQALSDEGRERYAGLLDRLSR